VNLVALLTTTATLCTIRRHRPVAAPAEAATAVPSAAPPLAVGRLAG
jgi:hypothetical protein